MSILLGDKKKLATVILAGAKNKGSSLDPSKSYPDQNDAPKADSSVAKETSMRSFLGAVDRKDPGAMASALETFYSLCSGSGDDDDADAAEAGDME